MTNPLFKLLIGFLNKPKFIVGFILSLLGTSLGLLLPQVIGKLLDITFLTEIASQPASVNWDGPILRFCLCDSSGLFLLGRDLWQSGLK